jgi:hypothetical protein
MATLIQSKQIQGVVTASVITGDFAVSGSQTTTGDHIVSGSSYVTGEMYATAFIGDGSRLRGVVAESSGINLLSGSVDGIAAKIQLSGSTLALDITNATASIYVKSPYEIGGLFRTYETFTDLESSSVSSFSQGQIVLVVDTNRLYQADIIYADFITSFTDTIIWNDYTFTDNPLSISASDGLVSSFSNGVTTMMLDTGSLHFIEGVQKITIDGGNI